MNAQDIGEANAKSLSMGQRYGLNGSMRMIDEGRVKLHNKPFDEMELTELYAEKMARGWHRYKVVNARNKLSMKKHWLEENKPILSKEEIKERYENGLLTKTQYQTAFANRKSAINYRMRIDDYMNYADRIIYDEESVIAYLDELILEKQAEEAKKKPKAKIGRPKKYDPRKKESKNNTLDPQRKWATREEFKSLPKLQKARARWKKGKSDDVKPMMVMKRMQPIITWDIDRLMAVARDRGYFTEVAVTAAIAEALNITVGGADRMLQSGKLSWGQCMVIGALFEMTPKEFCDIFMSGYFREVADGVFKAQVDDIENLLDAPYRAKPRSAEEDT